MRDVPPAHLFPFPPEPMNWSRAFAMAAIGVGVAAFAFLAVDTWLSAPAAKTQPVDQIERCLNGMPGEDSPDRKGLAVTHPNGKLEYCVLFRVQIEAWSSR